MKHAGRLLLLTIIGAASTSLVHLSDRLGEPAPIILAAKDGDLDAVEKMLANNARLSVTDGDGRTPLIWAAWNGHAKVTYALLHHGADVDATDDDEYTALLHAACGPDPRVIDYLVEFGASVESRAGQENWTPLMFAVWNRRIENVRCLIKRGADVNARNNRGRTALDIAKSDKCDCAAIAKELERAIEK